MIIKEILNQIEFTKTSYRELIDLTLLTHYKQRSDISSKTIQDLHNKIQNDERLYSFIALLYLDNGFIEECIQFLNTYIDKNVESQGLEIYIYALYDSKTISQEELLELLKKWRLQFSIHDHFLRMEASLRILLPEWKEIKDIAKLGLKRNPTDEFYFTLLMLSFLRLEEKENIKKYRKNILNFSFENTENVIRIVANLHNLKLYDLGIELLYQKAKDPKEYVARTQFFGLMMTLPKEVYKTFFVEYNTVEKDRVVQYKIDGKYETIPINHETINKPIVKASLHKKVGEKFMLKSLLGNKLQEVRIDQIFNKYLALIQNIQNEINESPTSEILFESYSTGDGSVENLNKILIENFGVEEEERRKNIDKTFEDYYSQNLSFYELSVYNFNASFIDTFLHLQSQESKGYFIKPLKYIKDYIRLNDYQYYVLDFSSGLLFYELSKKFGLQFPRFKVSEKLYHIIKKTIEEAETNRNSNLTLSIRDNKVIPHFYDDGFHENRIHILNQIRNWFLQNTESITPEEKIGTMRILNEKSKVDLEYQYFIETALLSQRENYLLISDDFGYERLLKLNKMSSTEYFLFSHFTDKKNDILEFMLEKRFIGITLQEDDLYSAFINQNYTEKSHIYSFAVQNISLKENITSDTYLVALKFLKKIALNQVYSIERYKQEVTLLFLQLLPKLFILSGKELEKEIDSTFELLPNYLFATKQALVNTVEILKKQKK